ncbi:MAG: hypothetical protein O2798_11790 [Chloroflexi bacterium]|nr:hypothetical protein [Chloroflexota bacterium]
MTVAHETKCSVCGESVDDPSLISECMRCGRGFHLRRRMDRPGIDCGDAVVGDTLGIETFCRPCIDRIEEEATAGMTREERALTMARMMMGDQGPRPGTPQVPPPGRRRFQRIDRTDGDEAK